MSCRETVLAELPGQADDERVLLVHRVAGPFSETTIELRQQTWAENIGWFTQSSVKLSPEQLGAMRLALGQAPATAPAPRPRRSGFVPRIVHADSA